MQDTPSSHGEGPEKRPPITDEEAMVGRAVLGLVASLSPARITLVELEQQLSKKPHDPVVARAVNDLLDAGLLELDGPYIGVTRIGLYVSHLGATDPKGPPDPPEPKGNGG